MNNNTDRLKKYKKRQVEERAEELAKNSSLIEEFITFCKSKQIQLTIDNFDYVQTTGIIAYYPNLVHLLNDVISKDKEELVEVSVLENEYKKQPFAAGFYYSDKYMVMAHPYFRRGHNERNNFAPRFLDVFGGYEKGNIQKYIAIDSDRVRVNVDDSMYMEFDTWYGAKFKNTISDIEDGIVKLRPPLELEPFHINLFFGDIYSLDIKWTSKNGIKVFQAEEFKVEDCRIFKNGKEYYPVKYLHAEFDNDIGVFRHFDGAIHFYTEEEYYQRRDDDFNYNIKNSFQLKTLSQKLFKVNGVVTIEEWIELVSHYLTGNPLVFEYFEGKLPDNITEIIDILRKVQIGNNNI
ncbi:hypothetical protein [Myroides odoratimimus]|uniref:hypothetical protein n=1 Tax=Myroides odoratimimus TaxID=76832 RepID=UPI00217F803A|nr:hypothetical protein [Myroides odoratimimus]MCS7472492.1 hypothetical protein [Myroides odoratimimus]MDM1086444.1 hypothetical protein [Myroides odoratimimus]MDM1512996.1 hypothetical protein [Myroides odoratimimus]